MYRAILFQQWRWTRLVVVLGTLAAFAVPLFSLRGAAAVMDHGTAAGFLGDLQSWGIAYPTLAGALGVLMAVTLWAPDHRGRHVYALALPVPRWRYVTLRYLAGLTLLAAPAAGLALGAFLASATVSLPPGLHPYPLALSCRFALAVLVAFTLFFSISAGTARTAGVILGLAATLVVAQILLSAAGTDADILMPVLNGVLSSPGPFAVFTGRWMLVDV